MFVGSAKCNERRRNYRQAGIALTEKPQLVHSSNMCHFRWWPLRRSRLALQPTEEHQPLVSVYVCLKTSLQTHTHKHTKTHNYITFTHFYECGLNHTFSFIIWASRFSYLLLYVYYWKCVIIIIIVIAVASVAASHFGADASLLYQFEVDNYKKY